MTPPASHFPWPVGRWSVAPRPTSFGRQVPCSSNEHEPEVTVLKDHRGTGVYWGRFNPPHEGHLHVIRKLAEDWNVVVAVGSSEHRDERANPFSGAERKRMLESYLKESHLRGVRVVTLKDGRSKSWALGQLIRTCKPDVLFLSTEKRGLARIARRRVRVVAFPRTGTVSSTSIRDSIAAGHEGWRKWTGTSVAKLIVELNGIQRIKKAYLRAAPRAVLRPMAHSLPIGRKRSLSPPRRSSLTGTPASSRRRARGRVGRGSPASRRRTPRPRGRRAAPSPSS